MTTNKNSLNLAKINCFGNKLKNFYSLFIWGVNYPLILLADYFAPRLLNKVKPLNGNIYTIALYLPKV